MPNTRQNKNIPSEQENPLFHDTWKLLKNYRDAVWNLELAVQQVRSTFEIEYGAALRNSWTPSTLPGQTSAAQSWRIMQRALNEATRC